MQFEGTVALELLAQGTGILDEFRSLPGVVEESAHQFLDHRDQEREQGNQPLREFTATLCHLKEASDAEVAVRRRRLPGSGGRDRTCER
jgi:hypothetical protein